MNAVLTTITLDELDHQGRLIDASTAVAAALADTGLVEVRPEPLGKWRLLPRGYVGAVCIDDLQIQVKPKERVGLDKMLFLLGYARDPGFRPEDITGFDEQDLWPALAESLGRRVEAALSGGVLQGYRTVDESLRTVRGRIRISDQISKRPGLMVPMEVTYDEFSTDISENRILRTALRRLIAVPRLPAQIRARLAHLEGRLAACRLLRPGAPVPEWQPSRLNELYQPALRLAELVLRNASAESGPGGVSVAAFVVPMWQVFENFVGTALAESLSRFPGRTQTYPQFISFLDKPSPGHRRGAVRIALDIVHLVHGTPRMIFDAKYKVEDSQGRYPNADHYQMLAYCTALSVPTAWLVYAQGNSAPTARSIRNTAVRIIEYPLDLRAQPRALLRQIDRLSQSAWNELEMKTT